MQAQLEDDDNDLYNLLRKHEHVLGDARNDEEQGSAGLKMLQTQLDRLSKRADAINRENFNLQDCNDIIQGLDDLDGQHDKTKNSFDEGIKKVNGLEDLLSDLEKKLKAERITECEKEQKLVVQDLEKLKRLLDRLKNQLGIIEKDQQYI